MKRPWSGQVEKAQDDDRPEFDPQVRKKKLRTVIYLTSEPINVNSSLQKHVLYIVLAEDIFCVRDVSNQLLQTLVLVLFCLGNYIAKGCKILEDVLVPDYP